jgi:hypothetical protein
LNVLIYEIKEDGWAGMQHAWDNIIAYKMLVGRPEWKRPIGGPRNGWDLKKQDVRMWTGFIFLRIGFSGEGGSCERSYKPPHSIKCGLFLD